MRRDRKQYAKNYYQENREKLLAYQHAYLNAKKDGTFQPKQLKLDEVPTERIEDLYYTREELEEAEPSLINWHKWDSLVEKTKQDIQDALSDRKGIIRCVYNLNGQLIAKGTAKQLERLLKPYMSVRRELVTSYSNGNKIKDGFYFTNTNHYKWESVLKAIEQAKHK